MHLLRPSCKDAYEIKSCGFVSIQNAITAHSPWLCKRMRNCAGMSLQEVPRRCYSSRIYSGTSFAGQTSSTTIESKLYSSGQKNMPASTDANIDRRVAAISH